eukprot:TRINITY_DN2084_c0_g1_i2.p1 TRINITY_DN2084_c0_g1~~TRINITY_DN2084_c0_g1_i2.p1  ORF type:complete len:120 (-),score=12.69 TRINITY_DN2084_c0_g1_i2:20-379(-)
MGLTEYPLFTLSWFKSLFYYHTVKLIQIKSFKLGLFHYTVTLLILLYIIAYSIVWEKGYQSYDQVTGSILTKVKGNSLVCPNFVCPNVSQGIVWDAIDIGFILFNILFILISILNQICN